MMKVKVWRKRGPAPAPFVVKGRPWEAAARWLSQAIRLGNLPQALWVVGFKDTKEAAQALRGFGRKVVEEVLKGGDLPIRGEKVHVPGWGFPALDLLGPEARKAREEAFQEWKTSLAASREEVGEGEEAEERPREDWAHDTGRPAPTWAHALLRAWQELREEGYPLPKLTRRTFRGTLSRALRGEGWFYVPPQVQEALEERAARLREGGWFPPTAEGLGIDPGLLEELLKVKAPEVVGAEGRVFSLQEMEAAIRLFLEYREESRPLEGVARVLEDLGLDWPLYPGKVPQGISSLFWLIHWAREEKRWGALAERLGTWNKRALRLARDLQQVMRVPGAPLEAATRALGVNPQEAAQVWSLLQQGSLEEWMKAEADEAEGAEPSRLRTYEEVLAEEGRRQQLECLHLALEAKGVTAEEVLADPALLEEVKALALAFYGEEE